MRKEHLKAIDKEQEQTLHQKQEEVKTEKIEFNSVEELLRHDAHKIPLPENLWERIKNSINALPKNVPFWKRLFKK